MISGSKEVGANGPLVQDQVMWYSHILPVDAFATGKQKLVERVDCSLSKHLTYSGAKDKMVDTKDSCTKRRCFRGVSTDF